jgi:hypothetical protein
VRAFPNETWPRLKPGLQGATYDAVQHGDGPFEAARPCGVGRRCSSDSRGFQLKDIGAQRGEELGCEGGEGEKEGNEVSGAAAVVHSGENTKFKC